MSNRKKVRTDLGGPNSSSERPQLYQRQKEEEIDNEDDINGKIEQVWGKIGDDDKTEAQNEIGKVGTVVTDLKGPNSSGRPQLYQRQKEEEIGNEDEEDKNGIIEQVWGKVGDKEVEQSTGFEDIHNNNNNKGQSCGRAREDFELGQADQTKLYGLVGHLNDHHNAGLRENDNEAFHEYWEKFIAPPKSEPVEELFSRKSETVSMVDLALTVQPSSCTQMRPNLHFSF